MATITVRDLDEATRSKLRTRAARNGRSMEAEVREILTAAVAAEPANNIGLGTRIHAMFAEIGGADEIVANIPPREHHEPGVVFDDSASNDPARR
ncbi:MAG: plasmid stabilization protein [Herbiconiux sp.]|uniref:FitA-like ribbon-helix-helix domain-containing protein n=1 Tax=Herbiconiux sp. TaxID=1871186 RepID=UPI00122B7E2C|nr:toxin-antitoxin system antitoxin subunit [Herbiconiux sp.]TAJ48939.1 MAG: plasmid stabilization protein [Herbiconiux sp.]